MYRFPEAIFITNSPFTQLQHVKSEIMEFEQAYFSEPAENVAIEALDAIHSLETWLRGFCHNNGLDIAVLHDLVVEKNRQRGYYAQ